MANYITIKLNEEEFRPLLEEIMECFPYQYDSMSSIVRFAVKHFYDKKMKDKNELEEIKKNRK